MKCPFCGLLVDEKMGLPNCPHCGSSIFHGIEVYSEPAVKIDLEAKFGQKDLLDIKNTHDQKSGVRDVETHEVDLALDSRKGRLQIVFESMGMAVAYSAVFTAITSPILYWLVQPHFLQSYLIEDLLAGSFLFYFAFGLIVFLVTPRFLPE